MRIVFNLTSRNVNSGGSQILLEQMRFLKEAGFEVGVYYFTDLEYNIWNNNLGGYYQPLTLDQLGHNDLVVISEEFAFIAGDLLYPRNIKYIMFNQGISASFASEINYNDHKFVYHHALAVMVNSEHSSVGVEKIFDIPKTKIVRYRIGINQQVYYPEQKEKSICFLTFKNFKFASFMNAYIRGRYPDWNIIGIDNLTRTETAAIFRKSKLLMTFGGPEGFGLPPLESALCGCKVIGFDGYGGKEYFKEPIFTTVNLLDHLDFIDKIDTVIANVDHWTLDDVEYLDYLRSFYNLEKSKAGLLSFYTQIKNNYF